MADNKYKLQFTLSNGETINAGEIVAPQGPKGDKGDSADIPYSSSTPFMDGVGSVGSANTVARGDHRHPSDTSRQEKLVSGTNIKTINGQSVLGSGDISISGGSEYTNTSEIVDNAITLTSTSTLYDLVNQILAQKTKVVRASWDSNLQRILPLPALGGPPNNKYSVYFKVWSDTVRTGETADFVTRIDCFATAKVAAKTQWDFRGYIWNGESFSGWVSESNPYPVGAIYIAVGSSYSETNPAYCFGGTWEHIEEGRFLLSATSPMNNDSPTPAYPAGSTGGSADAVVVSHNHRLVKDGSVLAISVPDSESETSAGFVSAPTGQGLWVGVNKATTGINSTGVDGSGKNMPPYIAVYMWKRIA